MQSVEIIIQRKFPLTITTTINIAQVPIHWARSTRLKIVWSIKRRNTMNYSTIGIPIGPKQ